MNELLSFTLFGSVIAFWVVLLLFIIAVFASEHEKEGRLAFASLIIISGLYYFKSNFDLTNLIDYQAITIYLIIGFLFALFRCYFYARKEKNRILKKYAEYTDIESHLDSNKEETLNDLKGNVFRWWFMWPASFLYWVFSDLLSDLYQVIYDKVAFLFKKIIDIAYK